MPANARWRDDARDRMSGEPLVLDSISRHIVSEVIRTSCLERGWWLHAVNARTNHVQVVVTASVAPELMTGTFKARSTLRLRERRRVGPEQRVWSRQGSHRYLWTDADLDAAVRYVLEGQ